MGKLQVSIPEELHRKFKAKTSMEGKTQREKLIELMAQWVKKEVK